MSPCGRVMFYRKGEVILMLLLRSPHEPTSRNQEEGFSMKEGPILSLPKGTGNPIGTHFTASVDPSAVLGSRDMQEASTTSKPGHLTKNHMRLEEGLGPL